MTARVAVFRPTDGRLEAAVDLLAEHGVEPVGDPLLEIRTTDRVPRTDAAVTVFTSKTGVEQAVQGGWTPGDTRLATIGPTTADAAEDAGFEVDVIPAEYTSAGLVEALADSVGGDRVEVARSDHGSQVLIEGLLDAGAYVHETVLYELAIPDGAGESVELAAEGELDAALFTSSLTVEHFLGIAADRGIETAVREGLAEAVLGAIGSPTAETAAAAGLSVDVVPANAEFEALLRAVLAELD
ncbi:MAG: uroporphyrinogen-III synthase [Halodesulfurarchaeum sp.]